MVTPKLTDPKQIVYYNQMVDAEPLKYVWNYVHITPDGIIDPKFHEKSEYMRDDEYQKKVIVLCNHLKEYVYFDKMTKIIEIKPELKDLLFYTKNQIFARKPFYPKMFFNVDVELEGYTVKGFYVEWIEHLQDMNILYVAVDKDNFQEFWGNFGFLPTDKDNEGIYVDSLKEERTIKKVRSQIRNVIANIIDFINQPQDMVEMILHDRNDKTNIKRLKKNKHPINNRMFLRPHPNFKEYLTNYNKKLECEYAFQVRGFWRHFHHPKFKGKKPIWVDSFVKNTDKELDNKRVVMSK